MEFDRLLEHFDDDARQQDEIGLIFYYLEEYEDYERVSQSDARGVISRSRSTITTSSIPTYFSRLRDDKWIRPTESDGYRLTNPGQKQVEEMLDEEAIEDRRDDDDLFLDLNGQVNDERYEQLIEDINKSYKYKIHDATMVLTRKLFEELVYQILKIEYAGEKDEMHFDTENGWHYGFDDLISNLRTGVPDLREYCRDLDRPLVDQIRDFKNEADNGAHSIRVDFADEEVEDWSDDATLITEVLYETLIYARRSDQTDS